MVDTLVYEGDILLSVWLSELLVSCQTLKT